jgi:hypothetical protein
VMRKVAIYIGISSTVQCLNAYILVHGFSPR